MKRFEDRSPAYQRNAERFVVWGLGGLGLLVGGLLALAGVALVVTGLIELLS